MSFPKYSDKVPTITTEQMVEVDRLMVEMYQIELLQMMENAGRALAILAKELFLGGQLKGKKIMVLAGTGGNGGGVMTCARRLHTWGAEVRVIISKPSGRMTPAAAHQLSILRNMEVSVQLPNTLDDETGKFDLILDGIIGYSLKGEPRGGTKSMIEWANAKKSPILALDTPSGVDLSSGTIYEPAVKANATLTLALPKKGLYEEEVKKLRGDLYLADISVPPGLYAEPSLKLKVGSIFSSGDILQLD